MANKHITRRVSFRRVQSLLIVVFGAMALSAQVTNYAAVSEVMTPGWTPLTFPIPAQPPALGGAGSTVIDTSIPTNTRIMRITTPADSMTGNSMAVPALGDRNIWATDNAHILYMDNNWNIWYVVSLNLANWPSPATIGARTRLPLGDPYYSYTDPDLVYGISGSWASSYRVSTGVVTQLFDFNTMPGWNVQFGSGYFTLSSDDRLMCTSNGPGQNSGGMVGCVDIQTRATYVLNVATSTVNGAPVTGYTFTPGSGGNDTGVHSLSFGMSRRYLQLQVQNGNPPVYWDLGSPGATLLAPEFSYNNNHSAGGYNVLARGNGFQCAVVEGSDSRQFALKPYAQMENRNAWTVLNDCPPLSQQSWADENHLAWTNNTDANPALTDKYPVFANITMHQPFNPQRWIDDEIVAFETDGAQKKVWHFFHNYTSYSESGCPAYLVGPHPSRDGRWVLFNSDWMGTLGPGVDCANRMDVFLAELRLATGTVAVSMSPSTVGVALGHTQQFTATVTGSSNTAVTWSMNPPMGTLSSTGLYTAPAGISIQPVVTITATSVADPSKTATAVVTLLPPGVTVNVIPANVSLPAGQSQQFTATVSNASNTGVTWSMNPPVGTLSSTGLYTPPRGVSLQSAVTIMATSIADPTKTSSATVTLAPPVSLQITPASVTLKAGQTQQFTAVGNTGTGALNWVVVPAVGTISKTGLYTAPATVASQQSVRVLVWNWANPAKSAVAVVTISPQK